MDTKLKEAVGRVVDFLGRRAELSSVKGSVIFRISGDAKPDAELRADDVLALVDAVQAKPDVRALQSLIAFGKYIAGHRPGAEGWVKEDQSAYDAAMGVAPVFQDDGQERAYMATTTHDAPPRYGFRNDVQEPGCCGDASNCPKDYRDCPHRGAPPANQVRAMDHKEIQRIAAQSGCHIMIEQGTGHEMYCFNSLASFVHEITMRARVQQ